MGAWLSGLAATIVSEADSEVVLQAPASNGSLAGDVHLEADTGALSVASGSWAFIEPGAILDVGLESGQVGTRVRMERKTLNERFAPSCKVRPAPGSGLPAAVA